MKVIIGNKSFYLKQEEEYTDLSDYIKYLYFPGDHYFHLSFYFKIGEFKFCFYSFIDDKADDIMIDISEFNNKLKFMLDFQGIPEDIKETVIDSIIDKKIRILL